MVGTQQMPYDGLHGNDHLLFESGGPRLPPSLSPYPVGSPGTPETMGLGSSWSFPGVLLHQRLLPAHPWICAWSEVGVPTHSAEPALTCLGARLPARRGGAAQAPC